MAEFGENLKNVREQKGYTQQTLADHLYVTRQAVSRWEGGSRYPDLMTAKKMAQFLEVSLDELLTDEDMKLYAKKSTILENTTSKRAQLMLLGVAFMSMLFLSMIQLFPFHNDGVMNYSTETAKYFLLTILLGIGMFTALFDRLTPKTTLLIYCGYFGVPLLTGILPLFLLNGSVLIIYAIGTILPNLLCLLLCIRFFAGKQITSPVPLYIATGIYSIPGIVLFFPRLISCIRTQDAFALMTCTFSLLVNLAMLALLVVMVYTLHRKRRLSVQ